MSNNLVGLFRIFIPNISTDRESVEDVINKQLLERKLDASNVISIQSDNTYIEVWYRYLKE